MSAPGETPQEDIRNAMAMLELARQLDDAAFVGLEGKAIPAHCPVEIDRETYYAIQTRLRVALEKLEGRPAVLGIEGRAQLELAELVAELGRAGDMAPRV